MGTANDVDLQRIRCGPVAHRSVNVDGLSIFYREAGPSDGPVLLLLHGFPSSSRVFDPLFSRLSDRFHLIAPDIVNRP